MAIVTVDDHKRVRIPDAKPGQVFSLESGSDGSVTLTPVKAERKLRYPAGSLIKYVTQERDELHSKLFAGVVKLHERDEA